MWGQSLKYFCLLLVLPCVHVHGQGLNITSTSRGTGTCQKDSDCALTLACIDNSCSDPCLAITATPCPMKGGICKVTLLIQNKTNWTIDATTFMSRFINFTFAKNVLVKSI